MVTKAAAGKKLNIPVDTKCPLSGASVHEDYDCMLNQTNIGANNNKFYVIQLLEKGGKYYAWTRWGRVGEDGQNALLGPTTSERRSRTFSGEVQGQDQERLGRPQELQAGRRPLRAHRSRSLRRCE